MSRRPGVCIPAPISRPIVSSSATQPCNRHIQQETGSYEALAKSPVLHRLELLEFQHSLVVGKCMCRRTVARCWPDALRSPSSCQIRLTIVNPADGSATFQIALHRILLRCCACLDYLITRSAEYRYMYSILADNCKRSIRCLFADSQPATLTIHEEYACIKVKQSRYPLCFAPKYAGKPDVQGHCCPTCT